MVDRGGGVEAPAPAQVEQHPSRRHRLASVPPARRARSRGRRACRRGRCGAGAAGPPSGPSVRRPGQDRSRWVRSSCDPATAGARGWYDDTALRGSTTVPPTTSHAWARTSPSTLATPSWSAGRGVAAASRTPAPGAGRCPRTASAAGRAGTRACDGRPSAGGGRPRPASAYVSKPSTASGVPSARASRGSVVVRRPTSTTTATTSATHRSGTSDGRTRGIRIRAAAHGAIRTARQPGAVEQDPGRHRRLVREPDAPEALDVHQLLVDPASVPGPGELAGGRPGVDEIERRLRRPAQDRLRAVRRRTGRAWSPCGRGSPCGRRHGPARRRSGGPATGPTPGWRTPQRRQHGCARWSRRTAAGDGPGREP